MIAGALWEDFFNHTTDSIFSVRLDLVVIVFGLDNSKPEQVLFLLLVVLVLALLGGLRAPKEDRHVFEEVRLLHSPELLPTVSF